MPFALWPAQADALALLHRERLVCLLKARQLGFSWLVLGEVLHHLLFRPGSTAILFSKRDDEAVELLDFRLKGMHALLPGWLRGDPRGRGKGSAHEWRLANGSRAMAFPTTGGRSYTASVAVIDEADFVPDLNSLLNAVKPTVDAGGKLFLLSTADKSAPESTFKRVYLAAREGANGYACVFHGWGARPDRDAAWYEAQKADVLARTGSLDDLHQEYPATDAEALAPRSLDKRIRPEWLQQCLDARRPLTNLPRECPSIPGLAAYALPCVGRKYVSGVDAAEGNPTSDDSAFTVVDDETGEEVCSLAGKYEPAVLAAHAAAVCRWYNRAALMPERNNHGAAVILWLQDNARDLVILKGHDGKPGWMSSSKGKALLYGHAADAFRTGDAVIHTFAAYVQLCSIEGATLRAPEGQFDDRADGFALALAGRVSHAPQSYAPVTGGSGPKVAPLPRGHAPPGRPGPYRGGYPR